MAQLPVNHPSRPFLRFLAGAIGLYILAFGVIGFVETRDLSFFDRAENWVLGLQTNPAFSILSILAGAVLLGGALIGRNIDHFINLAGGVLFLVAGIFMMTLLHTDANLLNFAMPNVIVSMLIGMALMLAGLYGKTGAGELAEAEERFRQGEMTRDEFDESAPPSDPDALAPPGESAEAAGSTDRRRPAGPGAGA